MLDLIDSGDGNTVPNNQDLPTNKLDIFYKDISAFLPPGKTFADLTEEEKREAMNKYRFSPLRPSHYQTITGIGSEGGGQ